MGIFFQGGRNHDSLYTQAQCTIAICELYGMSKDETLRKPAELAIAYCVNAQDSLGGWRYEPRNDSDTSSQAGWSWPSKRPKMAGLIVPSTTLEKIGEYLDKASSDGGSLYGFQAGKEPTKVMTAEGLLCRQYLGWAQDDPRLVAGATMWPKTCLAGSARRLLLVYGTQMMHHWKASIGPCGMRPCETCWSSTRKKRGLSTAVGIRWAKAQTPGRSRLRRPPVLDMLVDVHARGLLPSLPIYSKLRQQLAQP